MSRRWETVEDALTGHRVQHTRTRHGTQVWVAPMPGFARRYAEISARYGSVDTHLPDGRELPVGVAHFLEHQMFQSPAGDVFDLYAARGASANAYTTFTHTSYLFSCTTQFSANLATLLDTMARLETTPESVEREKGIIGQEIAMYADDADWLGYFGLLAAMYRKHPRRLDIAGTAATIAPIDRDLLASLHAAYYAPRNLVLSVAGDVDPDEVVQAAEARLTAGGHRHRRVAVTEPARVGRTRVEARVSIQRPQASLGFKDKPPGGGQRLIRQRVLTRVVLDALFGDGGRVQAPLHRAGWVDDSFGAHYEAEADAAYAIVGGETDDVEGFRRVLLRAVRAAADEGLTDAEVERSRRRLLGQHVRLFNAPARVASWMLGAALDGVAPDAGATMLQRVTRRMATRRLRELAQAPRSWSILLPRTERDSRPA